MVHLGLQPRDVINDDNVNNYSILIIIITRKYEKPYSGMEVIDRYRKCDILGEATEGLTARYY